MVLFLSRHKRPPASNLGIRTHETEPVCKEIQPRTSDLQYRQNYQVITFHYMFSKLPNKQWSKILCNDNEKSNIPYTMPLIVIDASAMLVASTTFRVSLGVLWKTLSWWPAGRLPCIGSTISFCSFLDKFLAASLHSYTCGLQKSKTMSTRIAMWTIERKHTYNRIFI